jgi:hypothetical protein
MLDADMIIITAPHSRSSVPGSRRSKASSMLMNRRHEGSNWGSGSPVLVPPAMPTAFETRATELSLTADTYFESLELRRWCQDNRNKSYIPEWLLKAWGISVNSDM